MATLDRNTVLEIGIPLRGDVRSIVDLVQRAAKTEYISKVHVALNPPSKNVQMLNSFKLDPKIHITQHDTDIGLYGNFRFLAKSASEPWFMWWCFDDEVTPELQDWFQFTKSTDSGLCVANFQTQNFDISLKKHTGEPTAGRLPTTLSREKLLLSALDADPSWIFGIWNSQYLKSIFPKKDFDWLDATILLRSAVEKKINVFQVSSPNIIGTFPAAAKSPHSVQRGGHKAKAAVFEQLKLCRPFLFNPKLRRPYIHSLIHLVLVARYYRITQAKVV